MSSAGGPVVGDLWLGLDPGDGGIDDRHLEHAVLDLLDALALMPGVDASADLVCTHVVEVAGSVRVAASARLPGRTGGALGQADLLAGLRAAWSGAAVLLGPIEGDGAQGDGAEGYGAEGYGAEGAAVEIGPRQARDGAREAARQLQAGRAARAARFPGQEALTSPLPVSDVPLVCAVEAVVPVVGEATATTVLDPSGHVRPRLEGGRLLLDVRPGPGGTVVPMEKRTVHACAGH